MEGRIRQLHAEAEEERRLNQEAADRAEKLKPEITRLDKDLQESFSGQRFIRHPEATELAGTIKKFTAQLNPRVRMISMMV